ncbi:ABC transporter substrate-binding protein [Frondihabitans australicus]|uniref:Peptide/nickel transport system substrate-binding protein n=1 Tax=Frondihabitans australicus TaxID=386892 RepID=A0A495IDL0_9MICO|nr:ABC transporter substrate-binding protein [Frondihabitans australicus]RKR73558.1 peptide/nickel transport system substrate-binding protein [Frondihabitans australicus]
MLHARRFARLAAVAAVVALAAAGCSIQIKSRPDPSIGSDTMLIAADTGSPTLTRNFNPFLTNARTATPYIYEPLVVVNNLDGAQHPWLASKVAQPNASTIDYTIRTGVKWSDGKAFTPADVAFTFALLKKYPTLDTTGIWQYIGSVSTAGDTVTVHLKSADAPAASIISQVLIVPQHIWKSVKHPNTWLNPNPVGTGPYKLGNFYPQQYSLDKNDLYWQASKVAAKHLILPGSNTQLDVVTKGYDWAYSFISDVKGTWLAANKDNKYWFPPGGTIVLYPNLTKAPFNNLDFRQGLSLALDRKAIGDSAAEGYMQQAGQNGLLLPAQNDLLDPSLPNKGLIAQDTKGALAAFAKAGYTEKGGKLVDAQGNQATLSLMTANGYTDWLRAVQAIQKELGAVGIQVKITQPQPAAYQLALQNGDFDLALGGFGGTGSLYQDFNVALDSSFVKPIGKAAPSNFERFSDKQTDSLLAQFRATTDSSTQKQLGYQLQQVVYDKLPFLSIYYGGSWGLYNTSKFTGWPTAKDPYASPKNYQSTPLLIFTHLKKAKASS